MKVIDIIKPSLNEGALSQVGRQEIIDIAGQAISDAIKFGKRVPSINDILRRKNIPAGTLTPKEIAELEAAAQKRAAEYPSMTDYLDGVVKGDQAQIDAYMAACLAVKAKYPKVTS